VKCINCDWIGNNPDSAPYPSEIPRCPICGDNTRDATEEEITAFKQTEAYDASTLQLTEIDRAMQQLFKVLTPLEQTSMVGTQAVQRFGMRRVPLAAQRFAGVRITEPVPKKKEPTAAELRKQGTREAYEKGIKLGYWQ